MKLVKQFLVTGTLLLLGHTAFSQFGGIGGGGISGDLNPDHNETVTYTYQGNTSILGINWQVTSSTGGSAQIISESFSVLGEPEVVIKWTQGGDFTLAIRNGTSVLESVDISIDAPITWYRDADNDGYGNPSVTTSAINQPTGYVLNNSDCNDSDNSINPNTRWYRDADGDGFGTSAGGAGSTRTQCSQPSGYVRNNSDCDDSSNQFNPNTRWYRDADGDGYGNPSDSRLSCTLLLGYVLNNSDCNDSDSNANPATVWYRDADGDGFGTAATTRTQCAQPSGYVLNNQDCNDGSSSRNPNTVWYRDADGDGYGNPGNTRTQCGQPAGYILNNQDCNDNDASRNPTTVWYRDADGDGFGANSSDLSNVRTQCTQPTGFVRNNSDCLDTDSSVNPNTVWYRDADGDGFGNPSVTTTNCTRPSGYVATNTDCNDGSATINPSTRWYRDADGDGFGTPSNVRTQCAQPSGYVLNNQDCNDASSSRNPTTVWYRDADGDGFGNPASTRTQCSQPSGYVLNNQDCNDANSSRNPNTIWYRDADGDGYGNPSSTRTQCSQPSGFILNNQDCNDGDATTNPTTVWYRDADGDGFGTNSSDLSDVRTQCTQPSGFVRNNSDCLDIDSDINPNTVWYRDTDGDGFGNPSVTTTNCTRPNGYVALNTDCNDSNAALNPNTVWYRDADGDGYGNPANTRTQCSQPSGYVLNNQDCNDGNSGRNPTTRWYRDADGDGFGNPSNTRTQCSQPSGFVLNNDDCNDTSSSINPNTIWYRDADGDGYGNPSNTRTQCTQPSGYILNSQDCNDGSALISPTTKWYADNDGDGFGAGSAQTSCTPPSPSHVRNNEDCDDSDAQLTPETLWYHDGDGDGFGDDNDTYPGCDQIVGYILLGGDCDDTNENINPNTIWYADGDGDGIGNANSASSPRCSAPSASHVLTAGDCDDSNALVQSERTWYRDSDGDGFGDPNVPAMDCYAPAGYVANSDDCNDNYTLANEEQAWYLDYDRDGFGNYHSHDYDPSDLAGTNTSESIILDGQSLSKVIFSCGPPSSAYAYVRDYSDCDDQDATVTTSNIWYRDADGDGYGEENNPTSFCGGYLSANYSDGYVRNGEDCDDGNADITPNTTWYADADADGYGNAEMPATGCTPPAGYVANSEDCDDGDTSINPTTSWYVDGDGDGFGAGSAQTSCTPPSPSHVRNNEDCDDSDAQLTPETLWYHDGDGDGFGDDNDTYPGCDQIVGYILLGGDCDDTNENINPNTIWYADSDGDGIGNANSASSPRCSAPSASHVLTAGDCDDSNALVQSERTWYRDSDGDGFGDPNVPAMDCYAPAGYVANSDDCNDNYTLANEEQAWYLDYDRDGFGNYHSHDYDPSDLAGTSTSESIILDGQSLSKVIFSCGPPSSAYAYVRDYSDCDDQDAAVTTSNIWYRDADGDGYGEENNPTSFCGGYLSANYSDGYVRNGEDCDDGNADITPNTTWYADADADGYGNAEMPATGCTPPTGYVANSEDCDDGDTSINPTTSWYVDGDGDGFGAGSAQTSCTAPSPNHVRNNEDCDDSDAQLTPETIWYHDGDGDGFGDDSDTYPGCDIVEGYILTGGDCDDTDENINPNTIWYADSDGDGYGHGASGVQQCAQPNGTDVFVFNGDDCDDSDPLVQYPSWYVDQDGDGFGDEAAVPQRACSQPEGFVDNNLDCNDSDPQATQIVLGYLDKDGDGYGVGDYGQLTEASLPLVRRIDIDGFVDLPEAKLACEQYAVNLSGDTIYYQVNYIDCYDEDATRSVIKHYVDRDGDGFGDINHPGLDIAYTTCNEGFNVPVPEGYASNNLDIDDANSRINPDTRWYIDTDGDGFGHHSIHTHIGDTPPVDGFTYVLKAGDECPDDYGLFSGCPHLSVNLNAEENYVFKRRFIEQINKDLYVDTKPIVQAQDQVDYIDGLGRMKQVSQVHLSPTFEDIVQVHIYDPSGRKSREYLPYVANLDGHTTDTGLEDQEVFYQNLKDDGVPYSQMIYAEGPQDRVEEQAGPGEAWQIGQRSLKLRYRYNTLEEVIFWQASGLLDDTYEQEYYRANETFVSITHDEDSLASIEVVNTQGETVLKKVQLDETTWAETYYVYDLYGNLHAVLPPEATARLANDFFGESQEARKTFLNTWAFLYNYDERNRMVMQKTPGADSVKMVYDQWDRPVLTQDGNQRLTDQWLFTKYDELNRPVMTGMATIAGTHQEIINQLVVATASRYETFDPTGIHQYTNNAYPGDELIDDYYTVTYYDSYDFVSNSDLSGTVYTLPTQLSQAVETDLLPTVYDQVQGQVTGTKTLVLGTGDYLESITYYDDRYRVIQVISENHLGGLDIISNQYNFIGNVRKVYSVHGDGISNTTQLIEYRYDHAERLLSCDHSINGQSTVRLYTNEYNAIGELVQKRLHENVASGSYEQAVDYSYNIRGWLQSINESALSGSNAPPDPSDLFSLELIYNEIIDIH